MGWRLEAEQLTAPGIYFRRKESLISHFHVGQGKDQLGRITGVGETVMQTGWVGSCWVLKHAEPFRAALLLTPSVIVLELQNKPEKLWMLQPSRSRINHPGLDAF